VVRGGRQHCEAALASEPPAGPAESETLVSKLQGKECLTHVGAEGRIKERLGVRAMGREIIAAADVFHLRERRAGYSDDSCSENDDIGPEKGYFRTVLPERSRR
jgi:hypothetical protein